MNTGYCPGCSMEDGSFRRGWGPLTLCFQCRYALLAWRPFDPEMWATAEEWTRRALEYLQWYWEEESALLEEETP